MKFHRHMTWAALLTGAASIFCGCQEKNPTPRVTINGKEWMVDVAVTSQQRYQGLSGKPMLPDNVGMLFIYRQPKVLDFCMRGCAYPLDIAFLDAQLRVVKVYTMQVEADQAGSEAYSSDSPAQYALETAGGSLVGAGVAVGMQAQFQGDIPPSAKAEDGP